MISLAGKLLNLLILVLTLDPKTLYFRLCASLFILTGFDPLCQLASALRYDGNRILKYMY